jgi:hypothetical protein
MSMESDTTVLPNSEPKRVKRTWKRLKSPNYERMREESKKLKHDILKSLKDYTPPNVSSYNLFNQFCFQFHLNNFDS